MGRATVDRVVVVADVACVLDIAAAAVLLEAVDICGMGRLTNLLVSMMNIWPFLRSTFLVPAAAAAIG